MAEAPPKEHLAQRELDVAGAGREVHDQVVQRAPLRCGQQLLDHACARMTAASLSDAINGATIEPSYGPECVL